MTPTLPQLGVCYYPEHWPETQWTDDAQQMKALGLSWVRIGEFAWSRMEASPGVMTWDWLDRAIDVLGRAGLSVVLGTPTATPPRWMLDKYPDMLAVGADGAVRKFGSRRHYCFSHTGYREECARIAALMGERYGKNPYVKAWQIDNEYGCHDTILSYGESAATAFRIWLETKYGAIEALNAAWGNVFWSMDYQSFAQIDCPNLTVTEPNPAHVMDYRRFASGEIAAFNKVQVDVLGAYTDAPLIHNYMGRITQFDHFKVGDDLDIASWDSYPLGFLEDRSDQGDTFKHDYMRQGDPDFQAFHHDLYRAVGRGAWWVMEQQPGPVNWAPYNPKPLPGMVRLWSWEAIAHGAQVVSYFRWRQAPFGQEQMHSGLLRADGAPADCTEELSVLSAQIASLGAAQTQPSAAAIVFDYASAWAWDTQPQSRDFDYFRLVYEAYTALRKLGLSVDILPASTEDFGDRKLILVPGLFTWNETISRAIETFSGQVVMGPRTGSKTPDFQIPEALPPNLNGFDAVVTEVESLRPSAPIGLNGGGAFYIWREHITAQCDVVERAQDGAPAHIRQGNLHYLAGWPDPQAMLRIMRAISNEAGLQTTLMAKGHRRRDFGPYTVHVNYSAEPIQFDNFILESAQVAVIERENNRRII